MRSFLRRKWVRRLLAATGLVVVLVLTARPLADFLMRDRLAAFIDKIEADDPDWRLDRLVAAHNAALPPDDRNSFLVATSIAERLPSSYDAQARPLFKLVNRKPAPRLQLAEQAAFEKLLADCGPSLKDARRIATLPDGGRRIDLAANPLATVQGILLGGASRVANLLMFDAVAAANANRQPDAVLSLRAMLNVGRSIGDEPSLMMQMLRMRFVGMAARTTGTVLALCEPSDADGLADLQSELLREADFPRLAVGFRGERAGSFYLYEWMKENGVPATSGFTQIDPAYRWGLRLTVPANQLRTLELATDLVTASGKPFDQQRDAIAAVPRPGPNDRRHYLTEQAFPYVDRYADGGLQCRSLLLCVPAGVAAERYHRKHGAWPASLEALVPEFLPTVPTDPFTGRPLGFERLPDGLAITPIGPDGQRDVDHGMRLWDPDKRRKPPSEGKS